MTYKFMVRGYNPPADLWVGVGRDGRVMYSEDAVTWAEYQSPAGESSDYWDISFGKDGSNADRWIIATNTSPELRYAADPTTGVDSWSSIDFAGTGDKARTVEYGANGTWIAATGDDVFRSTDGGDNWTKITDVASGAGLNICLATDGSGNWVMGGATKVLKSTDDGLNWYVTLQSVGQTNGLEYNNGIWFRAGNGSSSHRIASLTDDDQEDSWSTVSGISTALWAICHIDGDTWMTANKGNDPYISTDNCASWTNTGLASPSGGQIMGLASDGTTVVSVGKDNKVNTSTDNGQSWTTRFTSAVDLLVVEFNKVKPYQEFNYGL